MEKKRLSEGFLIEDERSFQKEQIESLIERCKKFAMLAKTGHVHILEKKLNLTDKMKLFLTVRFLGEKLTELEPNLGLAKDISKVHSSDLAKFLSVSEDNIRTRISDLIEEGFGNRPEKGYIRVFPHKVEAFLDKLENKAQAPDAINKSKPSRKKAQVKPKTEHPKKAIMVEEVIKRLSVNLNIAEAKIKDFIFLQENGEFKFNRQFTGKTKYAKQIKCILCTAFVLTVGMGLRTFNSRQVNKVCFNSGIDISGLNYAIRDLKNGGKITKASRNSQDNIILEEGKGDAKDIFAELCK